MRNRTCVDIANSLRRIVGTITDESVAARLESLAASYEHRCQLRIGRLTPKVLAAISCLASLVPVCAQEHLKSAPAQLALEVAGDPPGERCRRIETLDSKSLVSVSLHRTFHDDFEVHPLSNGKWVSHYSGSASWPEALSFGGEGSDFERKTEYNGEQQIYVDPWYGGRTTMALGLDPFKIRDGILSIVASRTPAALKPILFNNEYVSGILTTQKSFSQKYGYFEIRSKIPLGDGVWPAFWLLANDGGWPPEIDVMEGRGQRPGDLVMTTHWRIPATGFVQSCPLDFVVPDATTEFHNYGVLWQRDRLVYFIDRKAVADIKVPTGFKDPMYMIVNLAVGSKYFGGVGLVDAESPGSVEFEIDRISAYQIDSSYALYPTELRTREPKMSARGKRESLHNMSHTPRSGRLSALEQLSGVSRRHL